MVQRLLPDEDLSIAQPNWTQPHSQKLVANEQLGNLTFFNAEGEKFEDFSFLKRLRCDSESKALNKSIKTAGRYCPFPMSVDLIQLKGTASYHRRTFRPPSLVDMPFSKIKSFFKKILFLHHFLQIFQM